MTIPGGFPRLKRPEAKLVSAVTTAAPAPSPAVQAEETKYDDEGRRILTSPLPAPMRPEATVIHHQPAAERHRFGFPRAKPSEPSHSPPLTTAKPASIAGGRGP